MYIVETGGTSGDGALDVAETAFVQIVHYLSKVIGCIVKERQEGGSYHLGAVLHH